MKIDQLNTFLNVVKHKSFSRASEEVGLVQSAVTQQIQRLEDWIGHPLFNRDTSPLTLTDVGKQFYMDATDILQNFEHAQIRAQKASEGKIGELSVGIGGCNVYGLFEDIIDAFSKEAPGINFNYQNMCSSEQLIALKYGRLDVGFMTNAGVRSPLQIQHIGTDRIMLVLGEDHPLASAEEVDLADLAEDNFTIIDRECEPFTHDFYKQMCRKAGFEMRIVQEVQTTPHTLYHVAKRDMVSLCPSSITKLFNRDGAVYKPLKGQANYLDHYIVWNDTKVRNPLDFLLQFITDKYDVTMRT